MSLRPWLFGLVLAACTSPAGRDVPAGPAPTPTPAPVLVAPAAPLERIRVEVSAPGMTAADLERGVVEPLERALSGLRGVRALHARIDEGAAALVLDWPAPDLVAAREAIAAVQRDLPPEVAPPVLRRGDELPAAVLRLALERAPPESPPERAPMGPLELPLEPFLRLPGVARIEWCGEREVPVSEVVLDLERLGAVPIDRVLAAFRTLSEPPRAQIFPPSLAELAALPIAGTDRRLSDLAQLRERREPSPCHDHRSRDAATLLVYAQRGVDPGDLAADFRALDDARGPRARVQVIPAEGESAPALLDLELASGEAALASLAECMRSAPGVRTWALVGPERASDGPAHLRLVVAPGPRPAGVAWSIGPVREALAACAPVRRVSVVAPPADSDHALELRILGPDPALLASVADAAAGAVSDLPGVTWARVFAPRERAALELRVDGDGGARRLPAGALDALRLVTGALELDVPGPLPLLVDLSPRPDTVAATLERLVVTDGDRIVPLAALVRPQARSERGPRYRVDRQAAALVELRLRGAGERDAVQAALAAEVRLPAGYRIELGDPGPSW